MGDIYNPFYKTSRALIIGINNYLHNAPLAFAVNDATELADILKKMYGFKNEDIELLLDEKAIKENIIHAYHKFTPPSDLEADDRIVVFFAGHGHTVVGKRGDVGYLVPHDGDPNNLATLIRMDDLIHSTDLIIAKHVLFIMDACFSGLMFMRTGTAGSSRFLKDMLRRHARQAIAAGKGNETVADSGGPLPKHSIFTGHLIEALKGKAITKGNILTANNVMNYLYDKVSKDQNSKQTPHFGTLGGDGDFIFQAPILNETAQESTKDEDIIITLPASITKIKSAQENELIDLVKQYISEGKYRIHLDDLVVDKTKEVISLTSDDVFALQGTYSNEEFNRRLIQYEDIIKDLQLVLTGITFWGNIEHYALIMKSVKRLSERLESKSGMVIWLYLRWYPIIMLTYSIGIAAICENKYEVIAKLFNVELSSDKSALNRESLVLAIGDSILNLERSKLFNNIPGHDKFYAARSEFLFKRIQPNLDDLLFLGTEYERNFDYFEIIMALAHADQYEKKYHGTVWGPVGRFGWKYGHIFQKDGGVLGHFIRDALDQGENWSPLKHGMFNGSVERFKYISESYDKFISRLNWH